MSNKNIIIIFINTNICVNCFKINCFNDFRGHDSLIRTLLPSSGHSTEVHLQPTSIKLDTLSVVVLPVTIQSKTVTVDVVTQCDHRVAV